MTTEQVMMWAGLYRDMLMHTYEGTLDDVFDAAYEWLSDSRFFPTVGDLRVLVEKRVIARREQQMIVAAQREAVALPTLPDGDVDWSKVRTADLPPGYDYASDPHWQAGIELMNAAVSAKGDLGPVGNFARTMAQRREAQQSVGFQGATRERTDHLCPACNGARYTRLGGWDGHPDEIGKPGSKFVMCATCCPNGVYSERAEREAARRKAAA